MSDRSIAIDCEPEAVSAVASGRPPEFRFSLGRLLLLVALASLCLAGFRVLSEAWSVWLVTAAFYLAVVLVFVPSR